LFLLFFGFWVWWLEVLVAKLLVVWFWFVALVAWWPGGLLPGHQASKPPNQTQQKQQTLGHHCPRLQATHKHVV
jgi:hypothetical protein